jgi:hypothetical protein
MNAVGGFVKYLSNTAQTSCARTGVSIEKRMAVAAAHLNAFPIGLPQHLSPVAAAQSYTQRVLNARLRNLLLTLFMNSCPRRRSPSPGSRVLQAGNFAGKPQLFQDFLANRHERRKIGPSFWQPETSFSFDGGCDFCCRINRRRE